MIYKKIFIILFRLFYSVIFPVGLLFLLIKFYTYLIVQFNDKDDRFGLIIFDSDRLTCFILGFYLFGQLYFLIRKSSNMIFTYKNLMKIIIIYLIVMNIYGFPFVYATMLHPWFDNSVFHSIIMVSLVQTIMILVSKIPIIRKIGNFH